MDKLLKKQKSLLTQFNHCQDMIKGSIHSVCSSCTRVNCTCEGGKGSKKSYRLTYKDKNQKTKIVYVPAHMIQDAERRIGLFEKARQIIDDLIDNNLEIFKQSSKKNSEKNT